MEKPARARQSLSQEEAQPATTEAYNATQYLLRRAIPPSLYYRFRTFTREHPILFLPFSRWRWTRWRKQYCPDNSGPEPAAPEPVEKSTEIVIEGFPRMGNTFAHIAFKLAQERPIKIGHHTHAPAQVVAASRMGIPTVVIAREPEQAIVSYLVGDFDPSLTMEQSLREYISFYRTIIPHRKNCVIASFEEVTTDYGSVISRVNKKYGTNFKKFEHTEENVKECFDMIDKGYEKTFGVLSEKVVSRPSESREALKTRFKERFKSNDLKKLREKAYELHKSIRSTSEDNDHK